MRGVGVQWEINQSKRTFFKCRLKLAPVSKPYNFTFFRPERERERERELVRQLITLDNNLLAQGKFVFEEIEGGKT
jgi:hypothetical protein